MITLQWPVMTQPPMRQQNRLGPLQVSVARHENFVRQFCLLNQSTLQTHQPSLHCRNGLQYPQPEVRCHLIIAAPSCVKLACHGTSQLGETAFHGTVNIFIGGGKGKSSHRKLFSNSSQPKGDGDVLLIRKNTCEMNGICPGAAAIHVLNRQAFIDCQRCVELKGKPVKVLSEASAPECCHANPS